MGAIADSFEPLLQAAATDDDVPNSHRQYCTANLPPSDARPSSLSPQTYVTQRNAGCSLYDYSPLTNAIASSIVQFLSRVSLGVSGIPVLKRAIKNLTLRCRSTFAFWESSSRYRPLHLIQPTPSELIPSLLQGFFSLTRGLRFTT